MTRLLTGPAVPIVLCLVLGALGGVATALVTQAEPAQPASFTPPRTAPPDVPAGRRGRGGPHADERPRQGAHADVHLHALPFGVPAHRRRAARRDARRRRRRRDARDHGRPRARHARAVARAGSSASGSRRGPRHVLVGSRRELAPVWERFGIVPIAQEGAARAVRGRYEAGRRADPGRRRQPGRRPRLDPFPATDDGFYRGRLRHGGYLDYEHSAYVLLIDKRGRQRVGLPVRAGHVRDDRCTTSGCCRPSPRPVYPCSSGVFDRRIVDRFAEFRFICHHMPAPRR